MSPADPPTRAEIVVDLDAVRHNVVRLRELVSDGPRPPALMVVVKADGYGHGMLPAARAARQAGAEWLGVATLDEGLAVRAAGDTGPLLAWLAVPGEDYGPALAADIDVAAYTPEQIAEIAAAARALGRPARVHLKVDTGLSRGGSPRSDWPAFFAAAAAAQDEGVIVAAGLWSHFACSDEPEHPANDAQEAAFRDADAMAAAAGLLIEVRHLANSAAALLRPSSRFDLVRFGIAAYGLSPAPALRTSAELGLVPAMTVQATVAMTKTLAAGDGVSYGHTFIAPGPIGVALIPLGYADGVPRHASSRAAVQVAGSRAPVLGRICMDQFVVEAPRARAGETAVLFGPGTDGEPTAQEWAEACDTISYEIVTRIRGRAGRRWIGER